MEKRKSSKEPECFVPGEGAYPLCKGGGKEECETCDLYEDYDMSDYLYERR